MAPLTFVPHLSFSRDIPLQLGHESANPPAAAWGSSAALEPLFTPGYILKMFASHFVLIQCSGRVGDCSEEERLCDNAINVLLAHIFPSRLAFIPAIFL